MLVSPGIKLCESELVGEVNAKFPFKDEPQNQVYGFYYSSH